MDQRDLHIQPLGRSLWLYHFITKTLASQALKTVTLGRSTICSSNSNALSGSDSEADKVGDDDKELPPTQGLIGDSKNNPSMNVDEMKGKNMALPLPTVTSLKKTVSINHNVEEILPSKKKKKKSLSFQKSRSVDQEEEEEEEPKPLRSILKVGSDLKDKSNSVS